MELERPPRHVRRRMLASALGAIQVDGALLDKLADDERMSPAHVMQAVRVTKLMGAQAPDDVSRSLVLVLNRNLAVQGPARARSSSNLACGPFDMSFVNASADLAQIEESIARTKRASLCLYGPPGSSKTSWVAHLADLLEMPLRSARASDLLDMYVGGSEKNIARAFQSARAEGAVLFIDEADSFLQDRSGAMRSWEITQVNELLVQMENFDGVFVAATNLVDTLDRASLRRFDLKVEFKPLRAEQRRAMLLRLVPAAGDEALRAVERIDGLAAGDFATVARQARFAGAEGDAEKIVAMLAREVVLRRRGAGRPIGFDG